MADRSNQKPKKSPILGQSHGLSDVEGDMIQQMIREGSHSSRELYIPEQDLAQFHQIAFQQIKTVFNRRR